MGGGRGRRTKGGIKMGVGWKICQIWASAFTKVFVIQYGPLIKNLIINSLKELILGKVHWNSSCLIILFYHYSLDNK